MRCVLTIALFLDVQRFENELEGEMLTVTVYRAAPDTIPSS